MNASDNENNASPSNRTPLPVLAANILTIALAAGCGSAPFDGTSGGLPSNANLALSPNGQQLLVSWRDGSNQTQAKLLTLSGSTATAVRDVPLPEGTNSTAWGRREHQLLVTAVSPSGAGDLLRVDLQKGEQTVLHKSAAWMRYPLEVAEDTYVFLEGKAPQDRFSQWRKLQGGNKTLLSEQVYSMAAPLDQVRDAVFLLEPRTPPFFRVFQGALPTGLSSLIDAKTWVVRCAEAAQLTCVQTRNHFNTYGQTFGTMELISGDRRCAIGDRWLDEREIRISRDGGTVVFHAATSSIDGPRSIFVVKNDTNCLPEQINNKPEGRK